MEQTITPEIHEQIKQEVIAEQRAKAQARPRNASGKRKSEAEREESANIDLQLLPLKVKYVPLFAKRYEKTFFSGNKPLYQVIEGKNKVDGRATHVTAIDSTRSVSERTA